MFDMGKAESIEWAHDDLMRDLASHLSAPDRMIWTDMQLGPMWSARPDVFAMLKSYTKPKPLAYEIKVSVSDFRSDITSGKWQNYLDYAAGVIFCVPAGLITKADIPIGCGLMVRGSKGWRTAKAPTLQAVSIPWDAMQKLLIDGVNREYRNAIAEGKHRYINWQRVAESTGEAVAAACRDLESAERQVEDAKFRAKLIADGAQKRADDMHKLAKARADKVEKDAAHYMAELRDMLALDENASTHEIGRELVRLNLAIMGDPAIKEARAYVENASNAIESAKKALLIK